MKFLNPDWVPGQKYEFWGAVIGAGVSLIEGEKAAGRAREAGRKADASREERLKIAQQNYDTWKAQYGDLEQDLVDSVDQFTVRDNLEKYLGQASTDVAAAQQKSQDMQARQMTRYGLDPSDQRYQESGREMGIERARMEVGARNKARTQAEEERIQDEDKLFSRRLAVGQYGRGSSDAQKQLSGAYGLDVGYHQDQETGYAQQAGQGYGLAGKFASKAMDSYGKTDGYSSTPNYDFDKPDYSDGMMADDYGSFSSGDLGW